jgi:hypothetical protein
MSFTVADVIASERRTKEYEDGMEFLFVVWRRVPVDQELADYFGVEVGEYATLDYEVYESWLWPTNPPKNKIMRFPRAFGSVSPKI